MHLNRFLLGLPCAPQTEVCAAGCLPSHLQAGGGKKSKRKRARASAAALQRAAKSKANTRKAEADGEGQDASGKGGGGGGGEGPAQQKTVGGDAQLQDGNKGRGGRVCVVRS